MMKAGAGTTLTHWLLYLAVIVICGLYGLLGSIAVVITGMAGLFGFWALMTARIKPFTSRPTQLATIVCLVYVAGGLTSLALHPHDPANQESALMRLSALFFLPLASVLALVDQKYLKDLMERSAALGALAILVYVAFELEFSHERAWGGAGNPGPFATVMAVQFAICTTAAISANERPGRILFIAGMIASALCVLASGMRTAIPILLVFPLISFWIIHRPFSKPLFAKTNARPIWFLAFVFALMAILSILQADRIQLLWHEALSIHQSGVADNSLGHRLAMWGYALEALPGNWLTGSGLETALDEMNVRTKSLYGFGLGKTHFHNIVFTSLLRGGVLDMATNLLFLLVPAAMVWVAGYEAPATGRCLLAGLFIVYGFMAMVNLAFGHDILDHYFIAIMALGAVLLTPEDDEGARSNITVVQNPMPEVNP